MFRYSLLLLLTVFSFSTFAQEASSSAPLPAVNKRQWYASFVSWAETMTLDNGVFAETDHAQFYGVAVGRSVERFKAGNWGSIGEGAVMFGQANGGSSGGGGRVLSYQTNYKSWLGAQASYRASYRPNNQVALSIGPVALFRQVKWPSEGTNFDIKSGADLNIGAIADIRLRLANRWEFRQSIGTLAFKASTIWSFGAGYYY